MHLSGCMVVICSAHGLSSARRDGSIWNIVELLFDCQNTCNENFLPLPMIYLHGIMVEFMVCNISDILSKGYLVKMMQHTSMVE